MNKLKDRWGITSNRQLIIIFIVFGITGTLAARLGEPLTLLLGISQDFWLYWPVRILIILPVYKVILLMIGWLFGEFDFFWNFVKKMLRRLTPKSLYDGR
ncbi:DUF6787 family protein [Planktosalinus lacus]|uniref:DUF6787 domain-containing protein n=1 Tax=Planktosalinus lacus TaxID=1526573 RepID=A0A8J2YAC4_9FLAO|nr:DUF6787 family protein [Planktosalinus lacus]GGD92967.1 hypothetical protein GCM10011312_15940 [Planktosalinus lacus]